MENERWAVAPGFPDYEISDRGRLRRLTAARGAVVGKEVRRQPKKKTGHMDFVIRRNGLYVHARAARLVATAFIGPPPFDGAEACHNDGISDNDYWKNLRWDTRKGNFADMIEHGTRRWGERHHLAKLSAADVEKVFAMRAGGATQQTIADCFGLRQSAISRILNGKRWKDPASG